MNKQEQIAIAEKRIAECEERRNYFVKKSIECPENKGLYEKMAETETEAIDQIREAIIEALLK